MNACWLHHFISLKNLNITFQFYFLNEGNTGPREPKGLSNMIYLTSSLVWCVYAREVWFGCREPLRFQFEIPREDNSIRGCWTKERARFRHKERRWFHSLVCTVCHALWKQRNAWCFINAQRQYYAKTLAARIVEVLRMFRVVHRQGVGVLDNG
jgi:hypothetical protein